MDNPRGAHRDDFEKLPKIDLHRHLLGSVRPQTLWELYQQDRRLSEYRSQGELIRAIGHPRPVGGLGHYIGPWAVFRQLIRTPENVRRVAAEAAADARLDGVTYAEFRTSLTGMEIPPSTTPQAAIPTHEYLDAIRRGFAEETSTVCKLVVSVPRHVVGRESAKGLEAYTERFFSAVERFRPELVVGVDLTGIESGWPASLFADFFREAGARGLPVTVHAGETEGAREIWTAIEQLGAKRIGHGTSASTDASLVAELIKRDIALEVCPTTSRLIGKGTNGAMHPIIGSELPIPFVICTDNPTVNDTTMSKELAIAAAMLQAEPRTFIQAQFEIASRAAFSPITNEAKDKVASGVSFDRR